MKKQVYDDETLLQAVELYAQQVPGKISAAAVARWAAKNLDGLQELRDTDFTRKRIARGKNGKEKQVARPCMRKIQEINDNRDAIKMVSRNVLLHSAYVDEFFHLPTADQISQILDARKQTDSIMRTNQYLERELRSLRAERDVQDKRIKELEILLDAIAGQLRDLQTRVDMSIKAADEDARRKILSSIGILDGGVDIQTAFRSTHIQLDEAFSIMRSLRSNGKVPAVAAQTENESDKEAEVDILDSLDDGIDF